MSSPIWGVGVFVILISVVVIIAFFWLKTRKKKMSPEEIVKTAFQIGFQSIITEKAEIVPWIAWRTERFSGPNVNPFEIYRECLACSAAWTYTYLVQLFGEIDLTLAKTLSEKEIRSLLDNVQTGPREYKKFINVRLSQYEWYLAGLPNESEGGRWNRPSGSELNSFGDALDLIIAQFLRIFSANPEDKILRAWLIINILHVKELHDFFDSIAGAK